MSEKKFKRPIPDNEVKKLRTEIQNLEAEVRELRRGEKIPTALVRLVRKLSGSISPRDAAMVILDAADELFGWDAAFISISAHKDDRTLGVTIMDTIDGEKREIRPPLKEGQATPIIRRIIQEGPSLVVDRKRDKIGKLELAPFGDKSRQSESLMFTPIRKGSQNFGVLSIQSYTKNFYAPQDLEILQVLADYCCDPIERTLFEAKLHRSEEYLRLLTSQAPSILWATDENLRLNSIFKKKKKKFGIDPVNLYGQPLTRLFESGNEDDHLITINREALKGKSCSCAFQWKDVYFQCRVEPLKDGEGEIIGCIGMASDVTEMKTARDELEKARKTLEKRVEHRTRELSRSNEKLRKEIEERKKTEKILARSEAIYREAIERASGVPYRLNYVTGEYEFIGDQVKNVLGLTFEQMTFQSISEIIIDTVIMSPGAPEDVNEYRQAFRRGEVDHYRVDLHIGKPDGEIKWVSDSSVPIRDEKSGEVTGALGILQDITDRKRVEEQARLQKEQLIQADKMVALGTLVSGMAHEINNPNHFIMSNISLVRDAWNSIIPILEKYYDKNGDFAVGGMRYSRFRKQMPRLLSGIYQGTRRIRGIVEQLKDFSRPGSSDMTQKVDLESVIESAVMLLDNMIRKSTNHFEMKLENDLPDVWGNFQRLEQVVINLLQNACQALRTQEEKISILAHSGNNGKTVIVKVRDEGVGMKEESLRRIPDPFYTTKREAGGTGLGLSISTKIMNEHGGGLNFRSAPGKGTTAILNLPAIQRANK